MINAITIGESARLVSLEKTIERGLGNFIQVGEALAEIRDSRLYRIEHKTFEDYCRKKWGFKRGNAHDLIETASAASLVQDIEQPKNRETVRPLTKLDTPEQQREAWADAVEQSATGKPTVREVEASVDRIRPIPATKFSKEQEDAVAASCQMIELLDQLRRDCLSIAAMIADPLSEKQKWEKYAALIQTVIVQMQKAN